MKTCWKTLFRALPLAALFGLSGGQAHAQTADQHFFWTVTGTGTETWYTDDLYYHAVSLSGNASVSWTPPLGGTATYSGELGPSYPSGSVDCGVGNVFDRYAYWANNGLGGTVEIGTSGNFSGSFSTTSGHTYSIYSVTSSGSVQLTVNFPDHYQEDPHTATRTASETGNNSVSVTDGQKNVVGFYAPPQPQNGGAMSGVTYSLSWTNPNVALFFSDTETTTTLNPNADIIAVTVLPGAIASLWTTTNYAVSGNTVTIGNAWSAASGATGYEFVSAKYANGVWLPPVTNFVADTSFLDTGIIPGTPCEYYVVATNSIGLGPVSATNWPNAVWPPQVPGPIATTAYYAVAAGDSVMAFSWTAATNADGYEAVLAHYVNGSYWQAPVTNYLGETGITYSNLMPGDPYEFYVVATNTSGAGLPSVIDWPIAPPHVPGQPGYIVTASNYAVNASNVTMSFSWPAAVGMSGYLSSYEAIFGEYLNGAWQPLTTNCTAGTNITIAGITPGAPVEFYVVATNDAGPGPAAVTNWPVAVYGILQIPSLWTTTNYLATSNSATIGNAWTAASGASGYEFISSRYVQGVWQPPVTNYLAGTSCLDTGIGPGTPCEYYVVATNANGAGPASLTNWQVAASLPAAVPLIWTTTNYMASPGSVTIGNAWSPAQGATNYQIIFDENLSGAWQTNIVFGTSFLETGIPPGTVCRYYVVSVNSRGWLASSPSATNFAVAAPAAVPFLWTTTNYMTSTGSATINNVWSSAKGATSYQLISDKNLSGVWQTNTVSGTSFLDTPISPGILCRYYVVSINSQGWPASSPSATNWQVAVGPYLGLPQTIPGHIQVQDYDLGGNGWAYYDTDSTNHGDFRTSEGVELSDSEIAFTGYYHIFYTGPGEWVDYTVNVTHSGLYSIILSAGKIDGASTNHIEIDGINVTGPLIIANTGSWNYQLLKTDRIYLSSGQHVLRLAMDGCGPDWGNGNFNDINVVADEPQIQTSAASLGVHSNRFGFTITGLSNQIVIVEGCTNLAAPNWVSLQTNTLGTNALYFGDSAWTNYRSRFYRVVTP